MTRYEMELAGNLYDKMESQIDELNGKINLLETRLQIAIIALKGAHDIIDSEFCTDKHDIICQAISKTLERLK